VGHWNIFLSRKFILVATEALSVTDSDFWDHMPGQLSGFIEMFIFHFQTKRPKHPGNNNDQELSPQTGEDLSNSTNPNVIYKKKRRRRGAKGKLEIFVD
jgi:hypothetical protein